MEHHPAFTLLRENKIASLNVTLKEFTHTTTGAQHIHIEADNDENVFLVALRTVPEDSTGVAHILEHTALCGSKKFPVRDPFFMMTRRSLNTFMNAFTSSDWTAYPFASLNKKDFNNLLNVYLDAVFFSRLDKLDFAQEGHRLEFSEADNAESTLEYKGVVFNEMKGAMSSISSQLWQALSKYLFPTSTYHFNSGGEPEDIPDLSYEELLAFYKTHYHPSNAIFMTYGNIPVIEHQEKFEVQVLQAFSKLDTHIEVRDEKRYFSPVKVQESYPNSDDDLSEKTHTVIGWLLGKSTNLNDTLKAQLLSSILMENSASPLMHALESTDLGNAPSPLCGLDDSQKELTFACGLAGAKAENADAIEALILSTLEHIAEHGINQDEIESSLHQLELHQREVGGDSYPYGLQLILKALTGANHRGDPLALLDLEQALEKLREDIKDPQFVQNEIKKWLLDNPHRVSLTLTPDSQISLRKELAEKHKLEDIKSSLSDSEKQAIIDQSAALKARQEQADDPGSLPKVTLADVPQFESDVKPKILNIDNRSISHYTTGTNGLVYQQVVCDLPPLSENELKLLSLYGTCVTELGAAEESYLDIQRRQSSVSGGVSGFSSIRGDVNDNNQGQGFYIYSGKALTRNHSALSNLMNDILTGARFDEHTRIKEIVSQIRIGMENSVTGSGHALAMNAAAAGISAQAYLNHKLSGLAAIQDIKQLDTKTNEDSALNSLADTLANIHEKIAQQSTQILLINDAEHLNASASGLKPLIKNHAKQSAFQFDNFEAKRIQQAWICNTQVNFCAKAYPTVAMGHEDSAALVILGHFLRNGFLHKTVREQGGAYGGGASQDSNSGAFRFYSYRDPRIEGTLLDFDASIEWLLNENHHADKLEEAILGTVSSLDRSESPAGKAKRCFHSELHQRSVEVRQAYRQRALKTTLEDLRRVASTYLKSELANTAIVTGKSNIDTAKALGLELIEL